MSMGSLWSISGGLYSNLSVTLQVFYTCMKRSCLIPIELRGKKAGVLAKKHVIDGFVIMQMVEMLLDLLMLREVNLKWFKGILNKEEDRTFCSFIFRFVCDRVKYVLKDK